MRIGILNQRDARDRRAWSGTPFYTARALEMQGAEIVHLGPVSPAVLPVHKALWKLSLAFGGKLYNHMHSARLAKANAKVVARRLGEVDVDFILSSAGSGLFSFLETDIPIAYTSDATFALMQGYYPEQSKLYASCQRDGEELEQRAISRAQLLLYPTEWAARSAREDYGADPDKIRIIPWGANFDEPQSRESALARSYSPQCRLLLVGVDWQRKGADIAIDTLQELRASGIDAELVICGCTPPKPISQEGLTIIPFINKNDPEGQARFNQLFRDANYFFLPTRNECFGMAFVEANSFGLPAIGTDTGGVSGVIRQGENGFLLPPEATGHDYAKLIAELHGNEQEYLRLVRTSRDAYDNRLNWDLWAKDVINEMQATLDSMHHGSIAR